MDVVRRAKKDNLSDSGGESIATNRVGNSRTAKRPSLLKGVILFVILAVIVYAGSMLYVTFRGDAGINKSEYQAVFLTNGQVYFGKVSKVSSPYVQLTNIYYLQVQQQVQPAASSSSQQPQVSLAKLGSELHGPEDKMYISRQQVLFWENLKPSGKVSQAIKNYQSTH